MGQVIILELLFICVMAWKVKNALLYEPKKRRVNVLKSVLSKKIKYDTLPDQEAAPENK